MIKRLLLASLALTAACSGTDGYDYVTNPDNGELEEVELATLEQAYVVQTTYGIRNDLTAAGESSRFRPCGPGQPGSQACFYPVKRNVQLQVNTDGIPLNADRSLWSSMTSAAISHANNGDNGFNYELFNQTGCESDEVCLTFRPEDASFSVPANVPDDHIRRFVQFIPTAITNGVGLDRQFKGATVRGDFLGMKARKVGAAGTCTSTNACGQGIRHMLLNALALATGYGLLGTASATGRGVDVDVDGNMSAGENILGTPCQFLQSDAYNPNTPGVKNVFNPECSE